MLLAPERKSCVWFFKVYGINFCCILWYSWFASRLEATCECFRIPYFQIYHELHYPLTVLPIFRKNVPCMYIIQGKLHSAWAEAAVMVGVSLTLWVQDASVSACGGTCTGQFSTRVKGDTTTLMALPSVALSSFLLCIHPEHLVSFPQFGQMLF